MLSTCEVYLDNVEVEESDMVGEEGMGFLNVMYNFEMERLINAARSTGFAECAFEDAARYANQRIAFGKPIGHNQMIQEKLALMAIKIDNMRNMVLKVAWQADQHQSLRTSAALANCTAHVPQWKSLMMRFKSWAVWAIPMRRASPASGVMSVVNVSAAVQTKL